MISKRDVQLGKIALKQGMVNKEQLTKCLALKKKLAKKGKKVQLGSLLIKKGYIDKDQLEEIVRLHNEKVGKEEGGAKKSRRSKRTSKTVEAVDDEVEKKARKKKKKKASVRASSAGDEEDEATATATKKPKKREKKSTRSSARTSTRTSKRARTSREARGKSKKSKKAEEIPSEAVESAVSDVDPALFQSAHDSDVETAKRRLIGCPECGKKYRVRPKQTGKRFNCRRCKYRIKVPKDLFEREVEPAGGVEVEEFVLSSSEQMDSDEAIDAVNAAKAAAAAANKAVDRIGKKTSIRELAKAAESWQAKPAGPQKKFGVKGLVTMVASFGTLALMIGGGYMAYQAKQDRIAREKKERIDKEYQGWQAKVDAALAKAEAAEKTGIPDAIGGGLGELDIARDGKKSLLQGNNQSRAVKYEEDSGLNAKVRDLLVKKGQLVIQQGGLRAGEAVRDFEQAAALDPSHAETQCLLADMRIRARQFAEAAKGLEPVVSASEEARALQGLAYELGDAGDKAVAAYEALKDPGAAVLVGRAYLVDRQWGKAMDAVRKSDLEGPHKAAAKIVEALALEGKKEFRQALASFDQAVAESRDLPYAYLARGAFRLRQGREFKEALEDIQSGNRQAATPWGYFLQGEAYLAMLQMRSAKDSYTEAVQAKPDPGAGLVAGIDPFKPPLAPDHRVMARCRLAFAFAAEGQLQSARVEIAKAVRDNPFSPYGQAAMTHLELLQAEPALAPEAETLFRRALDQSRRVGGSEADTIRSVSSAYLHLVYGALLVNRTRYGDAIASLKLAAELDPSLAPAAKALQGEASRRNSRATDASEAYLAAARLDSRASAYRNAVRLLSRSKTSREQLDGAVQSLLLANPYSAHAHVLRARVLLKKEKPQDALKAIKQALELNPELSLAYTRRALFFLRDLPDAMHDAGQAGKDIDKATALEVKQGGVRSLTYLARAHWQVKKGQVKAAIATLTECLTKNKKYAEAFRFRASLHVKEGNKAKAQADLKRYKELTK